MFGKPRIRSSRKDSSGAAPRRKLEDLDFWSLVRALDAEVSYRVRTDAAIAQGMGENVRCYTCGSIHRFQDMDCGHMIRREYMGTRFDRSILRVQCTVCNRWRGGMQTEFRARLVDELGELKVQERENHAKFYGQAHPDRLLLIDWIKAYREENGRRRKEKPWLG